MMRFGCTIILLLFHGLIIISQKKFFAQVGATMIDGEFVHMASGAVTIVGEIIIENKVAHFYDPRRIL